MAGINESFLYLLKNSNEAINIFPRFYMNNSKQVSYDLCYKHHDPFFFSGIILSKTYGLAKKATAVAIKLSFK